LEELTANNAAGDHSVFAAGGAGLGGLKGGIGWEGRLDTANFREVGLRAYELGTAGSVVDLKFTAAIRRRGLPVPFAGTARQGFLTRLAG